MERHDPSEAMHTLRKAIDVISTYKRVGDTMYKKLSIQEREVRRIYNNCTQRLKAIRKKEKQRARAMFGNVGEEKKDSEKKSSVDAAADNSESLPEVTSVVSVIPDEREMALNFPATENLPQDGHSEKRIQKTVPKKRVSFADGSMPGDSDDNDSGHYFLQEHKEALFLLTAGMAIGCLAVHLLFKKRT